MKIDGYPVKIYEPQIRKELRAFLVEKYGVCYWCGRKVKEYSVQTQPYPDDMATIDHLKSRFFREKGEKVEKVLSCAKCNANKGQEEDKRIRKIQNEK